MPAVPWSCWPRRVPERRWTRSATCRSAPGTAGCSSSHLRTFGGSIDGLAACPTCGTTLEVSFPVAEPAPTDDARGDRWWPVPSDLGDIRFRLPTGGDLVAIEGIDDPARARRRLIGRCVEVRRDGRRRSSTALPAPVVREVAGRMADEDPDALIDLGVTCPACGASERVAFDAASYVWTEVEALGGRLVREVRVLASAFGWGEAEILALPPSRRNAYLELVGT